MYSFNLLLFLSEPNDEKFISLRYEKKKAESEAETKKSMY